MFAILSSRSRDDSIGMPTLSDLELEFVAHRRSRKRKRSSATPTSVDDESTPLIERTDRRVAFDTNLATLVSFDANQAPSTFNPEEPGGKDHQVGTNSISSELAASTRNRTETLESTIGTEMTDEINNELAEDRIDTVSIGGSSVTQIDTHRWQSGQL